MMKMTRKAVAAAAAATLLLAAGSAGATTAQERPPSTGQDWISLDKGIEFQPSSFTAGDGTLLRQAQKRFLAEQSSSYQQNNVMYVDSTETYYDGYAQAWRYIGFYTDCDPNQYYYDSDRRRRRNRHDRDLNSGDGDENPCVRYLLWAAVSIVHSSLCWLLCVAVDLGGAPNVYTPTKDASNTY